MRTTGLATHFKVSSASRDGPFQGTTWPFVSPSRDSLYLGFEAQHIRWKEGCGEAESYTLAHSGLMAASTVTGKAFLHPRPGEWSWFGILHKQTFFTSELLGATSYLASVPEPSTFRSSVTHGLWKDCPSFHFLSLCCLAVLPVFN